MAKHLKWLLVLIVILMLASSVAAQEPVELTIAGVGGAELQWLNEYVKPNFEAAMAAAGTPVVVTPIEFTGSGENLRQQYALDLGAGGGSDVLAFDGFWLPEFAEGGLLQPLTALVGDAALEWEGWSVIPPAIQEIMGYNGDLYGMPRGTDGRVIWVRTDLLEQAGLPADWQPTSWAELLDGARAVQEALPGVSAIQLNAGTAMGEATTLQGYIMALLGAGEHVYNFETGKWIVSSPAILDTLELYQTIYGDEELGNVRWQLVQNGRDLSFEAFSKGEVAMLVEGDYFWRSVIVPSGNFPMENRDEVVNFVMMPAQEPGSGYRGQDFVSASGGTGFVLNPNSANLELSWQLMEFMFGKDAADALQELQPRIRARTDVSVPNDEVMTRIATEVLPLSVIRPQLPAYNQVSAQIQLMTERIVSGEMTPEEAMAAYDAAVVEIVGEENVERIPLDG